MTAQLYCFGESGNAYKAALTMALAGRRYRLLQLPVLSRAVRL
jgi:glutathione S-transferase